MSGTDEGVRGGEGGSELGGGGAAGTDWEKQAGELGARLGEVSAALSQAQRALASEQLRRQIEVELVQAETVDIETARLLTEAAVSQVQTPDVAGAVAQLRAKKPFLFRAKKAPASATGGAARAPSPTELVEVAAQARQSGDRRSLLRYLRARRGVG